MAIGSLLRVHAQETERSKQRYEDLYSIPAKQWLPLLSLGHRAALADLVWMSALVYFGEGVRNHGALSHVFTYADSILELDPDFRAVYHWLATAGLYRPQQLTRDDVDRTIAALERGANRFPDDGQLAWDLGATLSYEVPPMLPDPAERDRFRERGAEYVARAVRLGAAPDWAVLSSSSTLMRLGRAEQAARQLEEIYAQVSDESIRSEIAARIAAIRSEAEAEALVEANREFDNQRAREMPYAPAEFFFWAGPAVDVREAFRSGFARSVAR
jgi:hypothetical protein